MEKDPRRIEQGGFAEGTREMVHVWRRRHLESWPSFQVYYCRRRGTHERRVDRCHWTTRSPAAIGLRLAIARCWLHVRQHCKPEGHGSKAAGNSVNSPSALAPSPSATARASHTLPLLVRLVLRNNARAKGSQSTSKHSKARSDISGSPLVPASQGPALRHLTAKRVLLSMHMPPV